MLEASPKSRKTTREERQNRREESGSDLHGGFYSSVSSAVNKSSIFTPRIFEIT